MAFVANSRQTAPVVDRKIELRRLLDGLPFPASMADLDGRIIHHNAGIAELFGEFVASAPDLHTWFERAYPEPARRAMVKATWERTVDRVRGVIEPEIYRVRGPEDQDRWVEVFGTVYDDCMVVLFRDTTEARRRHRAAEAHAQFNEAVIANAAEGICVCYEIAAFPFVKFTVWNSRMREITGYSMAEINEFGWYQSLYPDPDVRTAVIERMSRMREGDNLRAEAWPIVDKSGRPKTLAISTSVLTTADEPGLVLGLMLDITQRSEAQERRRQLESKIQQAQRLESLGVLAGGIAHDFNNLLAIVVGHAELALADLPHSSTAAQSIREIVTAGESARRLTDQMLAYVGKRAPVSGDCDINAIVRDNPDLEGIGQTVELRMELTDDLPACRGDLGQLHQVVSTLIRNAREALEGATEAPRLAVQTNVVRIANGAHPQRAEAGVLGRRLADGHYVSVQISDNGSGIDGATLERIFEPFFSTKFQGRGLSLAAVLGILRAHDGEIWVSSEPGTGSTFEVVFPTPDTVAEDPLELGQTGDAVKSATPRLALVVDDEAMVRQVTARMLEKLGFTVLEADDGIAALDVLADLDRPIDLVMLDLTMPRLDGVATLRRLRELGCAASVVLMSGYTRGAVDDDVDDDRRIAFLQKPFRTGELRATVAAVMAKGSINDQHLRLA